MEKDQMVAEVEELAANQPVLHSAIVELMQHSERQEACVNLLASHAVQASAVLSKVCSYLDLVQPGWEAHLESEIKKNIVYN